MLELISTTEKPPPPKVMSTERKWKLRLYVAGQTPRSILALANLRRI